MRLLITHLTRMQPGFICAAGIDLLTGRHIRPVGQGRLPADLLEPRGGFLNIGNVIYPGQTHACGRAPEIEDHRFDPKWAKIVRDVDGDELWKHLYDAAATSLRGIFGDELHRQGTTCAVDLDRGKASLGCLIPKEVRGPEFDASGRLRIGVNDGEVDCWVRITDLRLYENDFTTPRTALAHDIANRIANGTPAMLSVGLSRPWLKPGDTIDRHWLQVNNIHLEDRPVWRV